MTVFAGIFAFADLDHVKEGHQSVYENFQEKYKNYKNDMPYHWTPERIEKAHIAICKVDITIGKKQHDKTLEPTLDNYHDYNIETEINGSGFRPQNTLNQKP